MRRLTNNPWIVCLAAASFFFFQYIQIAAFNVLKPVLILAYNTTSAHLSLLSSLYFYGTVLFLIPAGILLDYLSTRTIILLAMALSLIGLLIFIVADSIYVAGFGRLLIGISGGPFCFLSTLRLASRWFPENRLAFVTGVIVAFAMLGGIIAQTPFVMLVDSIGWKTAMYLNLALGIGLSALIYLFVYDYPIGKEQEYLQQIAYYREIGFINGLKIVTLKLQNWCCGIFAMLLNLPIFVFGALWGIMYLQQSFLLTRVEASLVCCGLFFGMLIGAPIFGYISDKICLRKAPMLIGLAICLLATVTVLYNTQLSFISLMLLFYLIGFGSSAQILVYPMVTESNKMALTGSALGLISVLVMSGGAIFQPLIGWLIELNWDKTILDGMPIYSNANYNLALWLLPITMLIATVIILCTRETYCRRS